MASQDSSNILYNILLYYSSCNICAISGRVTYRWVWSKICVRKRAHISPPPPPPPPVPKSCLRPCILVQLLYLLLYVGELTINARHMRTRVTVVCVSVCYRSTDCSKGLYNKMNIPGDFTLISKGFQLIMREFL